MTRLQRTALVIGCSCMFSLLVLANAYVLIPRGHAIGQLGARAGAESQRATSLAGTWIWQHAERADRDVVLLGKPIGQIGQPAAPDLIIATADLQQDGPLTILSRPGECFWLISRPHIDLHHPANPAAPTRSQFVGCRIW